MRSFQILDLFLVSICQSIDLFPMILSQFVQSPLTKLFHSCYQTFGLIELCDFLFVVCREIVVSFLSQEYTLVLACIQKKESCKAASLALKLYLQIFFLNVLHLLSPYNPIHGSAVFFPHQRTDGSPIHQFYLVSFYPLF